MNEDAAVKIATALADYTMFVQRSFLLDLSRELNRDNISYAQFFLLGDLANQDYLTMTSISQKMGHSTAAAVGLIDRLEKLGYVQRLHAMDDRRKIMVRITRKGTELVNRMRKILVANHTTMLKEMDIDSNAPVVDLLGKLSE